MSTGGRVDYGARAVAPYAPIDLLHDLGRLEEALGREQEPLDAYLLACAAWQLLEDRRDRDVLALGRVAEVVSAGGAVRALRGAAYAARAVRGEERAVARVADAAGRLAGELAADVLAGEARVHDVAGLRRALAGLPDDVRRTVARLPACFHSFDQHPEDCRALARAFAARGAPRESRLPGVGLPTSGRYLAP